MAIIGLIILVVGVLNVVKYEKLKKQGIKNGDKRLYDAAVHKLTTHYIVVVVGLVITVAGAGM